MIDGAPLKLQAAGLVTIETPARKLYWPKEGGPILDDREWTPQQLEAIAADIKERQNRSGERK